MDSFGLKRSYCMNKQSEFILFPREPLYKVHWWCKVQRTKGKINGQETTLEQAHETSLVSACLSNCY